MARRDADALGLRVEQEVATLGAAGGDRLDDAAGRDLEVLLRARQDALRGIRIRERLVDVDADAEETGFAGGVEDAVARLAGDVWANFLPPTGSLNAAAEKSFVTYALTTLMSGLIDLAPSS